VSSRTARHRETLSRKTKKEKRKEKKRKERKKGKGEKEGGRNTRKEQDKEIFLCENCYQLPESLTDSREEREHSNHNSSKA
jgi:ribosomal protein L19E